MKNSKTATLNRGRAGGSVKSARKTAACRRNAKLPRRREITRARALALIGDAPIMPTTRIFRFILHKGATGAKFFKKESVIEFVIPSRKALAKNGGVAGVDEIVCTFNIATGASNYELRKIKSARATQQQSTSMNINI